MYKDKPTLAIYGIQDINDKPYPSLVHDHNIAFAENGEIKKFCQLERITRKKYDHRLPAFLYDILKQEKFFAQYNPDLVFVDNIIGRSFINKQGNIRFEAPWENKPRVQPGEGRLFWLDKHCKGYVLNHELAHIFSNMAFYGEFKDNSLHIHFDGGASNSNFSAWLVKDGNIQLIEYNWDLKQISSFFNSNALTFAIVSATNKDQNGMPGKFMGFASYGSYDQQIEKWLKQNNYFTDIWNKKSYFFERVRKDWGINLNGFDQDRSFIRNIAATFQGIFERELLLKLEKLKRQTGAESLYYSGGSALNIKANARIISSGLFNELFIPPCTNDSGLSIGAASYIEWLKHGIVKKHSPYLNNWSLGCSEINYSSRDLIEIIELIRNNEVVAVCNGFGEAGPRALGNRSIIARPDSVEVAEYVSRVLKGREWYRPIAPIMLYKNLEYFTGKNDSSGLSNYMLLDFPIKHKKNSELAGCIHIDGTSRIQTIKHRNSNPFMYDLLTLLQEKTGLKALINTSFNAKGRPIVHSPKDAINEAGEMGIKHLVVNGTLQQL